MNILLTSVGRRTYMVNYFKKAVGSQGLVFASNSILTYSMLQADSYVITPEIYDESYISFLLEYCCKNRINAVVSLFDIDLPVLAKYRCHFEREGISVIVSDERVTEICNDKWKTYLFCKSVGILQPKSELSLSKVVGEIENGTIKFPLIIKPRWGMGSIGIETAESVEELKIVYKRLKKKIFETYLRYESLQDIKNSIIIQEQIKGQEYGLDILNDLSGKYVTTIAKKKLAMRSGETDIAEIVDSSKFVTMAKTISQSLGHVANLDVDCFLTQDDELILLEMNCRFGGQYPFSHLSGVDFPSQITAWLRGERTNEKYITPSIGTISCKEIQPVVFIGGKCGC